ncbi:2-C-methyl-D-erythritol 2,4-cyclodiphosphate synthase [Enterococcus sp. BWB1-3]|uniref:2-C-methyl-D-erythritol 2,4-cyclodiphosphate synthase n=1 Tax=unclassified Enterococcus TaxID=2608891 RepID=UPI0019232C81|nr:MULTISPECIES: 2-C-methyl-D-erythritol 2,4-cyclodiphosphate synthase [unclassified Enterococcus]MBL1229368.1 2-C-methyl-D-erythritol 2,4-cyclodiphosphate synthase [Enterococcus sp. BWB1-3]MCB5951291.1 2-C-methyl-D-erythritol 2,4-cyclodiphosphate synthase [Enterococcus sp. BWT-B8]MCB5956103.1 2-C-methyl-D-erythritol 2,4-cyclodiphosphate synthase [Enterococcus sp. CWB-B31]
MFRIGQGFDVHQLAEDRKLIVGGVEIPFSKGLLGHSDADILLHAITDAILGGAGLGDIGHLFPDTDPAFKNADSMELLYQANKKVMDAGFTINNIDCTILAEQPKMKPYLEKMKENIAETCKITAEQVNIKATTMEKMGFIGREEGMGAMAVALLEN